MKNSSNNRGFAFIEYHNHKCAEYSRQKMTNPNFKLGTNAPTVSWADPRNVDSSGASQVLFIYLFFVSSGDWPFHQITAVMLCYMNHYLSFNFVSWYSMLVKHHDLFHFLLKTLGHKLLPFVANFFLTFLALWSMNIVSFTWSYLVQVKAVYVKNLPRNVTQDQLKKLFEHHGRITKVVVPPAKPGQEKNRIGFVHFAERSSAMKALKNTEKYELDGDH